MSPKAIAKITSLAENDEDERVRRSARDAVKEVVRHKIRLFGGSGTVGSAGFVSAKTVHRTAHIGGTEA